MTALVIEILGYILVAAAAGFLLGYLIWGWSMQDRLSAARAEGALDVRTSVDGDVGLRAQLQAAADERLRLEAELDRLSERVALYEGDPELAPAAAAVPAGAAPGATTALAPDAGPRTGGQVAASGAAAIRTVDEAHAAGPDAKAGAPLPAEAQADPDAPDLSLRRIILSDSAGESTDGTADAETPGGTAREPGAGAATPTPAVAPDDAAADGPAADGGEARPGAGPQVGPVGAGVPLPPPFTALRQRRRTPEEPPVADQQGAPGARPDGGDAPRSGFMLRRPRPSPPGAAFDGARLRRSPDDGRPSGAPAAGATVGERPTSGSHETPVPGENLPHGPMPGLSAGERDHATEHAAPRAAPAVAEGTTSSGAGNADGSGDPATADGMRKPEAAGAQAASALDRGAGGTSREAADKAPDTSSAAESEPAEAGASTEAKTAAPREADAARAAERQGGAGQTDLPAYNPHADGPEGTAAANALPRPADATLATQVPTAEADAPVIDGQTAGGADGAPVWRIDRDADTNADLPRPAESTRMTQDTAGPDAAPVVDEQVPPSAGAGAGGDAAASLPETHFPGAGQAPAGVGAAPRANGSAAPLSLLPDPPDRPDELRRIRGIGRVMERHLNQHGIWLYRQIAGLTPQGIEWLAGTIGGPADRIRRDRWVEQAQALYRIKYGREHDAPET